MTGVSFILSVPAMPAGAPPPAGIKVGRQRVPGVPRRGPAPAGATEITMSKEQYLRALSHVFPSDALNPVASEIDGIAVRAAQNASKDPRFLSAWAADDMKLAGTLFHSQAAQEVRRVPPGSLPSGWRISAERTLQAGRGGGRADVFLEGPAGQLVEVDWKTTGSSAVSSKAVSQMQKHSGQVRTMTGGSSLTQQESRSWIDYVRALVPP